MKDGFEDTSLFKMTVDEIKFILIGNISNIFESSMRSDEILFRLSLQFVLINSF